MTIFLLAGSAVVSSAATQTSASPKAVHQGIPQSKALEHKKRPSDSTATPAPAGNESSPKAPPFGSEFEVCRSQDSRYRVRATRLASYPDGNEVGPNHGYFRIRVEDHVSGNPVSFPDDLFLYYGAIHPESLRDAFVWHPKRNVLLYTKESARHWHTNEVWEFHSGGAKPVPIAGGTPRQDPRFANETEVSFSSLRLDFAEKAAKPVYVGMSPPEPLPADWAHIEPMHSYGRFERWEGDDIVFGVGLNVWKTNKRLEAVGAKANGGLFTVHVRGRLHFTTATPEHPAHLRVTHMEFRRPKAQRP